VVHVRCQVRITGSTMTYAPPKGGKERDVPLPDSIALRLAAHVEQCPPVPVTLPWKVPGGRPATHRLRQGEAFGLAAEDIDWLRPRQTYQNWQRR
jgi:hypothetical protein